MEESEATAKRGAPVHVLAIPYPTQGHVFPLLWLAKQLASRGVTVTILSYEDIIRQIKSKLDSDADAEAGGVDDFSGHRRNLRFEVSKKAERPPIPDSESMYSVVKVSEYIYEDSEPIWAKYLQDKQDGRDVPTCIVSDMFLLWSQGVADQLEIPRYMMVTSGATLALFIAEFRRGVEEGKYIISAEDGRLIYNEKGYTVPGLPHLSYHELASTAIVKPDAFLTRSTTIWQSSGLLVNTFLDLEDQIIESYNELKPPKEYGPNTKNPKVYAVGPLRSTKPDFIQSVSVSSNPARDSTPDQCLAWLSSQPQSSVLYVAFGTVVTVKPDNIRELALALKASQQRFLWVMRGSTSDALPNGFEAEVGKRGLVVRGWAPQVAILAHPATGAFLTHCGWNSCLESILMGVPMIGWPGGAEQHINCRDLMDRLKILEQIQTGPENVMRQSEALRAIRLVMVEEEGKLSKGRIKRLQKLLIEATSEGGSRSRQIQEFVDDLRQLQ